MHRMFESGVLGKLTLANRFIFPPIKTGLGSPKGEVTDGHLIFYRQIAKNGPGMVILEPVSVTADGKEHPKQLCVHLPHSAEELKKIVDVIHGENRWACLHRVKSGESIGCNINPEVASPELQKTEAPLKVLVAGGGPAGMSAALYLSRRGHTVTLAEKEPRLGGQFNLAWQAPGKRQMKDGLLSLARLVQKEVKTVMTETPVDADRIKDIRPDPEIRDAVPRLEVIGDADQVQDIYSAVHAGYQTARKY